MFHLGGINLPDELVSWILIFCDIETLFRSSSVSKKFSSVVDQLDWNFVLHFHGWNLLPSPPAWHYQPKSKPQAHNPLPYLGGSCSSDGGSSGSCFSDDSPSFDSEETEDFDPHRDLDSTTADPRQQTIFWYLKRKKLQQIYSQVEQNNSLDFRFEFDFQKFEEKHKIKIPNQLKDLLRVFAREQFGAWHEVEDWKIVEILTDDQAHDEFGILFNDENMIFGLTSGQFVRRHEFRNRRNNDIPLVSFQSEDFEGWIQNLFQQYIQNVSQNWKEHLRMSTSLPDWFTDMIRAIPLQDFGSDRDFDSGALCLLYYCCSQVSEKKFNELMGEGDNQHSTVKYPSLQVHPPLPPCPTHHFFFLDVEARLFLQDSLAFVYTFLSCTLSTFGVLVVFVRHQPPMLLFSSPCRCCCFSLCPFLECHHGGQALFHSTSWLFFVSLSSPPDCPPPLVLGAVDVLPSFVVCLPSPC